MSGQVDESDGLPRATSAAEALENAVEESRREYDKKVETMEEIDDKAMRSVRTAVILAGLVVSAVSVNGPSAISKVGVIPVLVGGLGVGGLAVSIVSGIGAHTVTQYPTGIGPSHREDVIEEGYSNVEWFVRMMNEYEEWSAEISEEMEQSLQYLEIAQFSLVLGVVALLVSASAIVTKTAYGIQPSITITIAFVCPYAIRTYLVHKD